MFFNKLHQIGVLLYQEYGKAQVSCYQQHNQISNGTQATY